MHVSPDVAAKTFRDLRAWQAARRFKLAVYRLTESAAFARDARLPGQLREAAASAASHIGEGFGRFDPLDFARFVKMARASIIECQNHLDDAVDRGYMAEESRREYDEMARVVLREVGGLLDYLQSPQARQNAERVRQQRIARRNRRLPDG